MREIKYNFLHWGPFVTHYKLLPEELQAFDKLEEGEDFKKGLAGHLKDEYELDKNRVFSIILPYLNSYAQGFWDHRNLHFCALEDILSPVRVLPLDVYGCDCRWRLRHRARLKYRY